jgi:hypothetical protein
VPALAHEIPDGAREASGCELKDRAIASMIGGATVPPAKAELVQAQHLLLLCDGIAQDEEAVLGAEHTATPIASADSGSVIVERHLATKMSTRTVMGWRAKNQTRRWGAGDFFEPKFFRQREPG